MRAPCANRSLRWALVLLTAMLVTSCATHRFVANSMYPQLSISVEYEGIEVMYTGLRSVNTEEEVMELLEGFPEFRRMLEESLSKILEEQEEKKATSKEG